MTTVPFHTEKRTSSKRRYSGVVLLFFLLLSGCAGTEAYSGLAAAGASYASAMDALLVDYRRTYIDARSENFLADENSRGESTRFDLSVCASQATITPNNLSTYAQEQCRDVARVQVIARLMAHSRLLGEYFNQLGALAESDAPQAAGVAAGRVADGIKALGTALDQTVPGEIEALAPLARLATSALQRSALRAELDRNQRLIRRELAIQDKVLVFLERQIRQEQAVLFNRRYGRLISTPVRRGQANANADRWIENRRTLLLETDQAARTAATRKALRTLTQTYEELVRGGDARHLIGQLLADTSMVLDVVEPLVGRP
jgi:hypothetical protein